MDKTKETIKNFMSKSGHHDTTVHEQVAPAVTHETVKPIEKEEVVTAVDKEVHQDHYHRQVQPVYDKEVLAEKHTHNVGGVVNREFDHRDHQKTEQMLQAEQAKLRDERVVHETQRTQTRAPVVEGEHVHHHVHETVQPVIQKEVIQPEVIHTAVPVHEVHHQSAQHHGTTTLPPVSINEFKQQGGVLSGNHERRSHFDGCPEGVHTDGNCPEGSHPNHRRGDHSHSTGTGVGHSSTTGTGVGHSSTSGTGVGHNTSSTSHNITGEGREGSGRGLEGSGRGLEGSVGGHNTTGTHGTHNTTTDTTTGTTGNKPSLLDRLNPMKDSDHDGKKGLMD